MPFLGLRLGNETQLSVADIQYLGALAEEHGYGEVWMTEGAGRDSLTQLSAIAAERQSVDGALVAAQRANEFAVRRIP